MNYFTDEQDATADYQAWQVVRVLVGGVWILVDPGTWIVECLYDHDDFTIADDQRRLVDVAHFDSGGQWYSVLARNIQAVCREQETTP